MAELKVHVLMRCSKSTGKVDTCMTGLGTGLMQMWALENTGKSKMTVIMERDTGKVVYVATGTADGFPKVKTTNQIFKKSPVPDTYVEDLGTCEDYGVSIDDLHSITDERFDAEV